MAKTILEMKNVTKRFPGVVALNDVSIDLQEGEILAICGENGAGKSTLMKILSGSYINKDYEGEIWIDGKPVEFTSVQTAVEHGIEMVYQELNIIATASIAENIFVGNLPGKGIFVDYQQLYKQTKEILEEVGMNLDPKEAARNLGSGQMQMLSIVRALCKNPRIMVLDEPTSSLSETEVDIMMEFLKNLRAKGVSCIFITHKLEEIFRIADRVLVIRDGCVVARHLVSETTKDTLIMEMVGRKVENLYPKTKAEIGGEILRIENLTVPHPMAREKHIVENISFSLRRGEILGLGGLVGAGRTETLGAIYSQIKENVHKAVYIRGKETAINTPRDAIEAGLSYVTEERKISGLVMVFSIRENLTLNSLRRIPKRYFIDRKEECRRSKEMFERLDVRAPSIETKVFALSGGNQQKVILGKCLLTEPDILLIDEPTKGIDVGAKHEIYKLMSELAAKGVAIIMVSSDMLELIAMSDRCVVLSGGHLTGEFEGGEITQENIMRAAIAD